MKTDNNTVVSGQLDLPLMHSEIHKTSPDGVEMGVLESGVPYLSQRGIVKMAGLARTSFQNLSANWKTERESGVGLAINNLLKASGYEEDELFIVIDVKGGKTYAYTEPVCLAILEYYAFDAKKKIKIAQNSYRVLSKAGFRVFVYQYTGYTPQRKQLDSWRHFHDRVELVDNKVPSGYFCVFREIAGMIVSLIRRDVIVNDKIIPDISVGIHWANYWKKSNLTDQFGDRISYEHNYPDYYPQANSNPQPDKAYPNEALAIFRKWFEETYLLSKFPKYMISQSERGKVEAGIANEAIKSVALPFLKDKIETPLDPYLKKALNHNSKH